jgi:hypothetical protein
LKIGFEQPLELVAEEAEVLGENLSHCRSNPGRYGENPVTNSLTYRAVSRRIPAAVTRFEPGLSHVGFVVDRTELVQVFSKYFRFLWQSLIPRIAPQSSSCKAGKIGQ